jgi:hypothetical protein
MTRAKPAYIRQIQWVPGKKLEQITECNNGVTNDYLLADLELDV